jgi:hypothetical protein
VEKRGAKASLSAALMKKINQQVLFFTSAARGV